MADGIYKTRVLGINLPDDVYSFLESEGMEVFHGTYGPKVDAREVQLDWNTLPIKPQFKLPDNLHEYDVIIEDMHHDEIVDYNLEDNNKDIAISEFNNHIRKLYICKPQNVFDPVPLGCDLVKTGIEAKKNNTLIKILFQENPYQILYFGIDSQNMVPGPRGSFSNYCYIENFSSKIISGDKVKLTEYALSQKLFDGLLSEISYVQTYRAPIIRELGYNEKKDDNFYPLLTNIQGDVISYMYYNKPRNSFTFMFPRVKYEKEIIKRLFNSSLYKHFSDIFPSQTANAWLTKDEYELPDVIKLEHEKKAIKQKAEDEIEAKDNEIKECHDKLAFLYGMLTDTGDDLVEDVVNYLQWLGFDNVEKADDEVDEGGLLQEDIRVELNANDLLIIEVKGVHGTSTDNECAQIGKNILRRFHEHKYHSVYGLYIVNNEIGKEPLKRTLPPFNNTQIQDARNSYRGLAYTYQLFNLYFEIQDGIITKKEAQKCLLDVGLVGFRKNFKLIGVPYSYFKQNTIICLELNNTEIKEGDFFYFEDSRKRLQKLQIKSIEQENTPVSSVCNGKTGFGLVNAVPRGAEILIKKQ
jgi:hypothetical protein